MAKTTGKPLSALRLERMKQGETVSDVAENRGLRVSPPSSAGWRYWYRYTEPGTEKQRDLIRVSKRGQE
jgi:hypothetical protein